MDEFDEMIDRLAKANTKIKTLEAENEQLQASVDDLTQELTKSNGELEDHLSCIKRIRTLLDNLGE